MYRAIHRANRRTGLALIEVVVCTLLVGTLLLTSLKTLGSVYRFRGENSDEQRGIYLAEEILSRIEMLPYNDPEGGSLLGRESFESYFNSPFDDMNDFHGFSESPPTDQSGGSLPGFADWAWSVQFAYVDPNDLSRTFSNQRAMVSTITIQKNSNVVATLQTVHVDSNLMVLP